MLDKEKPSILLDTARNVDAFKNLLLGIRLLHYQRPLKGLAIVLGAAKDTFDSEEFLKITRYFFKKTSGQLFICPLENPVAGSQEQSSWDVEEMTNKLKGMTPEKLLKLNLKLKVLNKIIKISKIKYYDRITYLSLSIIGDLKKMPEEVNSFTQLQELNLSINKISKIENLDKLTQLKYLDLGFNNISKIEGLDKLINLQKLRLSQNQISRIEGLYTR